MEKSLLLLLKRRKLLPPEDIRVRTSLKEQQRQLVVVLLPRHQPIRLNMTLPLALVVTLQLMRLKYQVPQTADPQSRMYTHDHA